MDVKDGGPETSPAVRASDRERDAVVQRVQDAFAEGRLDDAEFDERTRAALTARTHGDLDAVAADLPAASAAKGPAAAGPGPGRFAIALKSSVRRAGRWRVPERYTTVVYKGDGWLDLQAAELTGPGHHVPRGGLQVRRDDPEATGVQAQMSSVDPGVSRCRPANTSSAISTTVTPGR